jgi:hypothetical protein
MPCISCAHLARWGNIQQKISERSLQTIEGKVKNIERDDRKYDGGVVSLSRDQWIVDMTRVIIPNWHACRSNLHLRRKG